MHCLSCGYDLRALEDQRCPECGRGFDAGDPKTWGKAKTAKQIQSTRAVGQLLMIVAVIVVLATIYMNATGGDLFITLFTTAIVGGFAVFVPFIIWLILSIPVQGYRSTRVYPVLAICVLVWVSVITSWPLRLHLLLSGSSLEKVVQQAASGNPPATPTRVGMWKITEIEQRGGKWVLWEGDLREIALVYQMNDQDIPNNFNIWSWRRVNKNWHLVNED